MALTGAEGNELQVLLLAFVALFGVYQTLCWCCSCCCGCCRKRAPANPVPAPAAPTAIQVDGKEINPEHLIQTKDPRTAYFLWLTMGMVGAHHFYADRVLHGVLAACSGNFFGVGWFLDFFLIPTYVHGVNRQVPAVVARPDNSCGRLCCRLPVICSIVIAVIVAFVCKFPAFLHGAGVVDLEAKLAGTAGNPYVILEVERDAAKEDVRKAYASQLREVETSKDCQSTNRACKAKKANLKKAAEFILHGPTPKEPPQKKKDRRKSRDREDERDNAWSDWGDYLRAEWDALSEEVKESGTQFAKNVEKDYFS